MMKKKTPLYEKPWVWVVAVIILAVIPFVINYAYLKGLDLQAPNTAFSASDWLSFYGTLIGALTTVVALVVTIRFTVRQSIQEQCKQKNTLIAEYKKVELVNSHKEVEQYALKIKALYLLDALNDSATGIERFLKQNNIFQFSKDYGELQYWASKLHLSDSAVEKRFLDIVGDFVNNTRQLFADLAKKLEEIQAYENKYEKAKQEFEERKTKYLSERPIGDSKINIGISPAKPAPPPYGEFKMPTPESKNVIMVVVCKDLEKYRDEHKSDFIAAFDALLAYKQKLLEKDVSVLYEAIDTEN